MTDADAPPDPSEVPTVSHPALPPEAIERLKEQVAAPEAAVDAPGPEPVSNDASAPPPAGPSPAVAPERSSGAALVGKLKGLARRAAAPAAARASSTRARAAAQDQAELRAELAELRAELDRTRADHAAELAALHEELADRPDPAGP